MQLDTRLTDVMKIGFFCISLFSFLISLKYQYDHQVIIKWKGSIFFSLRYQQAFNIHFEWVGLGRVLTTCPGCKHDWLSPGSCVSPKAGTVG